MKAARNRNLLSLILLLVLGAQQAPGAQPASRISYIPYEDARPIIEALKEILPDELRSASAQDVQSRWAGWVARRDGEIRARLARGDEDSLVNFLLFGTSFTRAPRIKLRDLADAGAKGLYDPENPSPEAGGFLKRINSRADDLIKGIGAPGKNERLLFARGLVESKGFNANTAQGREGVRQYLLANLARVFKEQASYARVLESARLLSDPSAEFAERSKLYSTRGLSSDTSLLPNLGIERSLASLKRQGLITPGSVVRVGVIGPGLDFTDKQDGYDFYPQQTIQPFAIIDTLLRLGLARTSELKITTFDLSDRVNDHLRRATARARSGVPYIIQLPRDDEGQWDADTIDYWKTFGDQIGKTTAPAPAPGGLGNVTVRAVRIKPAIVARIRPEDVNVVLQRPDIPDAERFDLLIATNILVYYDVFEQCLALANIEKMLRPGGFLLSNNALLELPSSRMHSVGYETVVYSARPNDGDHVVWYQRAMDK